MFGHKTIIFYCSSELHQKRLVHLPSMKNYLLILCIILGTAVEGQVTWSTDISPILYENCVSCHRADGIAPFSLITYSEAKNKAGEIEESVFSGEMPPWPADENYTHFAFELVLTEAEKNKIADWIGDGLEPGDTTVVEIPEFEYGTSVLETISSSFSIGEYTTQYDEDEYRHFVIETGFTEDKYFNTMEIIPGNWNLVHHVDIYLDNTNYSDSLDQLDPLAGFNEETGWPYLLDYIGGWSPGSGPLYFPENWGIKIGMGYDLVVQIHYAPDNIGLTDSTRINFSFVEDTDAVRKCNVTIPLYNPLGQPLIIPADSVITFRQQSSVMTGAKSLVAIMPHMHMLGKSYTIWYETSTGDSVPVIDIPEWDFHWQYFYTMPKIMKIPTGARFHAIAVYDNTVNNPENPNDPPITVYEGAYTKDEMLMTFMAMTDYEEGDELIVIDSSFIYPNTINENNFSSQLLLFPNPANDEVSILWNAVVNAEKCFITDLTGRKVMEINTISSDSALQFYKTINISGLPKGVYLITLQAGNKIATKKLFVY